MSQASVQSQHRLEKQMECGHVLMQCFLSNSQDKIAEIKNKNMLLAR